MAYSRVSGFMRFCSNCHNAIKPWDPVGPGEVAEIAGVSLQRIWMLRGKNNIPAPVVVLKSGPIWDRETIEEWAATRKRTPGRSKSA